MAQSPSIKKSLYLWDYSLSILMNFIIFYSLIYIIFSYISEIVRSPFPRIPQALEEKRLWPFRINLLIDKKIDTSAWNDAIQDLNANTEGYRISMDSRFWAHGAVPSTPEDMDNYISTNFKTEQNSKSFNFFLFCDKDRSSNWIVGTKRAAWKFTDCEDLRPSINQALPFLYQLLSPPESYPVKMSPFCTLSYTLLNSHPTMDWKFRWDWDRLYQGYLEYFLQRVQPIFDPIVESQILHYGEIVEGELTKLEDGSCVSPDALRTFIGKTQWNVVSTSSVDRTVEYMIYIPSEENVPLSVCGHSSDSFSVPRWGTTVLYNPPSNRKSLLTESDLRPTFKRLLFHLRSILGLPKHTLETIHAPGGIADWEVDWLFRAHTIKYTEYIRETLMTTQDLIDQNPHVPVTASMAEVLTNSIDFYNRAMTTCEVGEYTLCASLVKRGVKHAMRANTHHGMLPMLHFSLKFTYATYSPFFLPTGLLVIYCFLSRLKYTIVDDDDLAAIE